MIQHLTIPGSLPDLNAIVRNSRTHWGKAAKEKKQADYRVYCYAKAQKLLPMQSPVWIDYRWVCKDRRKDPSNTAAGGRKIIEDSLQNARVLEGDGWRHIAGWRDTFAVDKKNPRIELTLFSEGDIPYDAK